jgi:hypothetical protein
VAVLTVTRTGGATGEVTATFTTSTTGGLDGARLEIDFSPISGQVTFADGQTIGRSLIPIYDDLLQDRPRSFLVTLTAPSGGAALGAQATSLVTIIDDDPADFDDLNGDGVVDLAVLIAKKGILQVRFGDGSGAFSAPTTVSVGKKPLALLIRDFTGDGVSILPS